MAISWTELLRRFLALHGDRPSLEGSRPAQDAKTGHIADSIPPCLSPITPSSSHLATLSNRDVHVRHVLATVPRLGSLHLFHDIYAVYYFAKDHVLVVQEGRGHGGDEELGAVGVWAGVLWNQTISYRPCRIPTMSTRSLVLSTASEER
jgi:hypothetical protein